MNNNHLLDKGTIELFKERLFIIKHNKEKTIMNKIFKERTLLKNMLNISKKLMSEKLI